MRYRVFDGFRGFFLIFMVVAHVNQQLGVLLGKINHHYFGWVEDAQGFVFISGLVVGLVYGGILLRKNADAMVHAVFKRCRTIYFYQALLIISMSMIAFAFGPQLRSTVLDHFQADDPLYTALSLLLVTAPLNMGILPMYLYFMLATPLVLIAFQRGHAFAVGATSASLWLLAQLGLTGAAVEWANQRLSDAGYGFEFGLFFNLFGWQVIYFFGLYLGFKLARKELDISWIRSPAFYPLFWVCVVTAVALGLFDRVIFDQWLGDEFSAAFLHNNSREIFPPIYLLAFATDLFIVCWLLIAGVDHANALIRKASKALESIFNHPALVFLGQHSLQVFAFHIAVVYLVRLAFADQPIGQFWGSLVLIASVISLYLPAAIHAKWTRHQKAQTRLEPTPSRQIG